MMTPIIERNRKNKQQAFDKYLINVDHFFSESELLRFGHFFTTPILNEYFRKLDQDYFTEFILDHTFPSFEEEIPIPYVEIWQIHHQFIENLTQMNSKAAEDFVRNFFTDRPFSEFLIVLGQRITPASVQNKKAIPPASAQLIEQAFAPYNQEIKIAVRAWEKHAGRTDTEFWGVIDGTPQQKEKHVINLVNEIIKKHTWWNVFEHFKHGHVYEIREKNGHGMRWSLDNKKFIGFVEPF